MPALPGIAFPSDLRVWLGEDRLLGLVLEAAAHHAGGCVAFRAEGCGEGSWPATSLVALTVFCHLTGRYGSETIAEEVESDPALRYLCAGRFPSATVLRRFRRWYRPALAAALQTVLEAAAEFRRTHTWLSQVGGNRTTHGGPLVSGCAARVRKRPQAGFRGRRWLTPWPWTSSGARVRPSLAAWFVEACRFSAVRRGGGGG
ncbi:MAG: transposase [Verrucomicrobia bacterium]|nr:transposase [Verrucomicrobiota bacterium]